MSVITQNRDSALMMAIRDNMAEVVSLLLEAGANTNLQYVVRMSMCNLHIHLKQIPIQ